MTIFQSIFLGIIQGLTEFLPISSSGHLVLFQKIFNISKSPIAFDVLVHFGTVIALFIFFKKEIKKFFVKFFQEMKQKKGGKAVNLFFILLIGTFPVVIAGFLLMKEIEIIFDSLLLLGVSFLITAMILFLTTSIKKQKKDINKINKKDALFVGFFQAFSILPGVSRSGSTISAALFRGIKKEDAFNFSFFLGIIAILGATIIQIPAISNFTWLEFLNGIIGLIFAALVGFLALKILKPIVVKGKLHYFGIYCMLLGIICLVFAII